MRRIALTAAFTLLSLSSPARAASPERWEATSTTSMAFTGNLTFAPDRITFAGGKSLPLEPAGQTSVTDVIGRMVTASLFRVTAPADPPLLHGNRLRSGQPVTFIAVWRPPPSVSTNGRAMEPFSGSALPVSDRNSKDSCGTYFYEIMSGR